MPPAITVELSEETHRQVESFRVVVNAIIGRDLDTEACLGLIVERGLESMLRDLLGPQDQATLLESIRQLALREPGTVYRYLAEVLHAGAMAQERENQRSRIGFTAP
ncbi:MAG TPA: hypothetical protein VGR43_04960 [Dehalococcoidia bacterium]|jgi:hypothetical protein|nr:hypothetical protein [Dehalococcoidia bacterium]